MSILSDTIDARTWERHGVLVAGKPEPDSPEIKKIKETAKTLKDKLGDPGDGDRRGMAYVPSAKEICNIECTGPEKIFGGNILSGGEFLDLSKHK